MFIRKVINKEGFWLFILLFGALVVRLGVVYFLKIEPISDSAAYMKMSISMLETGTMEDGQGNIAFYSSGWSLFLIPFLSIFGKTPETVQVVSSFLGAGSVFLVYLCAKSFFHNWKWAFVAGALWATYPPAILYAEYIAKENLLIFLFLLQALLLLRFRQSQHKMKLTIFLGIIFGFELLVGAAVILMGLVIFLVIIDFKVKRKFLKNLNFKFVFVWLVFVGLTILPWLNYTYSKLGTVVLNTNGGFNLYLGNNPNAKVHYIGIQDTPIGPEWHEIRENMGEIAAVSHLKKKAIEYIIENPAETLWLSLGKVTYFWKPPIHDSKEKQQGRAEKIVRLTWLAYYCFILIFALLPLAFYRKLNRSHCILYGTVILYCAIHAAAYVIFRYRLPIMPMMCILAVCGMSFMFEYWEKIKANLLKVHL